jgi:hypothetical protein
MELSDGAVLHYSTAEGTANLTSAVRWDPGPALLRVTVPSLIPAFANVTLVISADFCVRLPSRGLIEDHPRVALEVLAKAGPILPTVFSPSPGFPSMLDDVKLNYSGYSAGTFGTIESLDLQFLITSALQIGDSLSLTLPNFNLVRGTVVVLPDNTSKVYGMFKGDSSVTAYRNETVVANVTFNRAVTRTISVTGEKNVSEIQNFTITSRIMDTSLVAGETYMKNHCTYEEVEHRQVWVIKNVTEDREITFNQVAWEMRTVTRLAETS